MNKTTENEDLMIYKWLFELSDYVFAFNVFRYITFRSFLSFLTAFFICWRFGPYFIQKMKKALISEKINTLAPSRHLKKQGTPTMGGVLILFSLVISLFFWVNLLEPLVWAAASLTFGFGFIGFVDDWVKMKSPQAKGLSVKSRLFFEFLISGLILTLLYSFDLIEADLYVPFLKDLSLDLSWGYLIFASVVIVGMANAVNLTDGLDGLAAFPIIISSATLGVLSYLAGHFELSSYLGIPFISGAGELAPFAMAVAAGGLGFLWYNGHPAQLFMGNVGSLSLGGFLGIASILSKNDILILLLGGVFVAEALSVIFQVFFFKLTGKRILSMAPLHHHFEMKGVSESKIIIRFWIVSILLAVLSLATLKLR